MHLCRSCSSAGAPRRPVAGELRQVRKLVITSVSTSSTRSYTRATEPFGQVKVFLHASRLGVITGMRRGHHALTQRARACAYGFGRPYFCRYAANYFPSLSSTPTSISIANVALVEPGGRAPAIVVPAAVFFAVAAFIRARVGPRQRLARLSLESKT
jgi:hypothetical protein